MIAGYRLPAKYVIHSGWPGLARDTRGEPGLLASCYRESLRLAREYGVHSIGFPAISCGVYGYPLEAAATIAVRQARLLSSASSDRIIFVCFSNEAMPVYQQLLDQPA